MTDTLLARLAAALRDCADDLAHEIDARYAGSQNRHEVQRVSYRHDMETVERARALLAEWEERKP